jgi:hypothetical protein
MSVDTHGMINRKIDVEEVYNFIINTFDKNAKLDKKIDSYDNKPKGYILFNDGKDDRQMFFCNGQDKTKYDREYPNLSFNDEDLSYLWLDLKLYGNSVEDMKIIINHFGGYVDENDCDDNDWYYLGANPEGTIPPVIHVTMQQIYDKFGGVVIITDR